jgi:putative transposase
MQYDSTVHHRRSIRLQGYNYSRAGAYFITVCTRNRRCLFGDIADGKMQLNDAGRMVLQCWQNIPGHFPHVALDAFVVMPNHLHGIMVITDGGGMKNFSPLREPISGNDMEEWRV